jgi:CheY-like chemotaxis protein
LWLPRAPGESGPAGVAAEEGEVPKVSKPIRILLVDDHEEVRTTTTAMLEDLGHTVVGAANGSEALNALRDGERDYGLMISDYAMPHLSGSDFLKEARALCPDVPALIITGYAEADGVRDRPEGVEILLKPFTAKALESAVARVCGAATVAG